MTFKDCLVLMMVTLLVLLLFFLALDYWSLKMALQSHADLIANIQAAQRPLVIVNGKYPHIVATRGEVLVEGEKD